MIDLVCRELLEDKDIRSNLIAMRQQIKADEQERTEAARWEAENGRLLKYLGHEDAKVRKNAALLLGELGISDALNELWNTYCKEQTLFVKSSYLIAMEYFDCSTHSEKLHEEYAHLRGMDIPEEQKKHVQEELQVLERMLRKLDGVRKHRFTGYDREVEVLLTTNPKYREATAAQIQLGRTALAAPGVKVKTAHIRELLSIRTYRELLFLLRASGRIAAEPDKIAEELCTSDLMEQLEELHEGTPPFYFRLEIKGDIEEKKNGTFIRKVAAAIEEKSGRRLINSADDYELEIRLISNSDHTLFPCMKLFTLPMQRFSYRKNAVAVSIHPVSAALLMQLAKPYLKELAQVLDPFCGVGTMLIERDLLVPAGDMYGTDIFGEAIQKARENTAAAGMDIHYINRNLFDFTHRYLFDEIVTNMPARGARTKEEQDRFYERFFEKVSELLKRDGILIMYSNESGFVKKQLRLRSDFSLKKEYCIREKTGYYLFVIAFKG